MPCLYLFYQSDAVILNVLNSQKTFEHVSNIDTEQPLTREAIRHDIFDIYTEFLIIITLIIPPIFIERHNQVM